MLRGNVPDRHEQNARERWCREALERLAPQTRRLREDRAGHVRLHVAQRVGQLLARDLARRRRCIGELGERLVGDLHRIGRPLRGWMHPAQLPIAERPRRLLAHGLGRRGVCEHARESFGRLYRRKPRQPDAALPPHLDGVLAVDHPVAHVRERRICTEPAFTIGDHAIESLRGQPVERSTIGGK